MPIDLQKSPRSICDKFDGINAKFCRFVQLVQLFLDLHPSNYPDEFIKTRFVDTLFSRVGLFWFTPLLEKNSNVVNNFETLVVEFFTTFGESHRTRIAKKKIRNLRQESRLIFVYTVDFQYLT